MMSLIQPMYLQLSCSKVKSLFFHPRLPKEHFYLIVITLHYVHSLYKSLLQLFKDVIKVEKVRYPPHLLTPPTPTCSEIVINSL